MSRTPWVLVRRHLMAHKLRTALTVIAIVIGGLGSFWGVVLAAVLVGVVRGVTVHFVPAASEASMYILMFLVLMLLPDLGAITRLIVTAVEHTGGGSPH